MINNVQSVIPREYREIIEIEKKNENLLLLQQISTFFQISRHLPTCISTNELRVSSARHWSILCSWSLFYPRLHCFLYFDVWSEMVAFEVSLEVWKEVEITRCQIWRIRWVLNDLVLCVCKCVLCRTTADMLFNRSCHRTNCAVCVQKDLYRLMWDNLTSFFTLRGPEEDTYLCVGTFYSTSGYYNNIFSLFSRIDDKTIYC